MRRWSAMLAPIAWTVFIVVVATRRRPIFGLVGGRDALLADAPRGLDAVGHAAAFFVLAILLLWAFARVRWRVGPGARALAALVAAGTIAIGSELLQSIIPTRGAGLDDVVVNLIGAGCGIAVVQLVHGLRRVTTAWARSEASTPRDAVSADPGPREHS